MIGSNETSDDEDTGSTENRGNGGLLLTSIIGHHDNDNKRNRRISFTDKGQIEKQKNISLGTVKEDRKEEETEENGDKKSESVVSGRRGSPAFTESVESKNVTVDRQKRSILLPPPSLSLKGQTKDEEGKKTRSDDDDDKGGRQKRAILLPPPNVLSKGQDNEEDEDEDDKTSRKGRPKVRIPEISLPTPGTEQGRGILVPPNLQLLRRITSSESSLESEEERSSSSGSEELPAPKTMADVVLLVQSMEARKKRHKEISDVILGVPFDMSELEKIAIICVLEDCIDQLIILGKTNNKPIVIPDLKFASLKDRFSEREKSRMDIAEIEGKTEAGQESKKILKLQTERAILEMILQDTLDDLKSNESYKTLAEVMILQSKQKQAEAILIMEENKNMKEVSRLRMALKEGRKECLDKINEKQEIIAQLKDEIQDTFFVNDLKFKYVSNWEKAREEQNTIQLNTSEETLDKDLTDLKCGIDLELRCHTEIEAYIKEAIAGLEEDIEKWMTRYENELEDRADEIQRLKAKRAEHYTELEELALMYQQRQKEIDAYLAHKEKMAAEAAHQEHLNRMATKIQAWWRGVMVRRKLGPYKKKKKGKEKGKGKGGKKKK